MVLQETKEAGVNLGLTLAHRLVDFRSMDRIFNIELPAWLARTRSQHTRHVLRRNLADVALDCCIENLPRGGIDGPPYVDAAPSQIRILECRDLEACVAARKLKDAQDPFFGP